MNKCKICGYEVTPVLHKHYIARDDGRTGVSEVFSHDEGKLYDAFDCPSCGCQIIAQERKREFIIPSNNKEDEDEET